MNTTTSIRTVKTIAGATVISMALLLPFGTASASTLDQELLTVQKQWAQSVYRINDHKAKYTALQKLALKTHKLSQKHPNNAQLMTWDGIVLSTFAGVKGGLGALSLAKEARVKLEKAKKINPGVLNGSIFTSLGTLYSKVPGWPLGFGNDRVAESNFKQALQINPNGIDPNYFYAEFLAKKGKNELAIQHLQKAMKAPARANRPLADAGRKMEVQQLLAKLKK